MIGGVPFFFGRTLLALGHLYALSDHPKKDFKTRYEVFRDETRLLTHDHLLLQLEDSDLHPSGSVNTKTEWFEPLQ